MTLESFTVEEPEASISIFTDSRDRVPEKDRGEDNPFWGNNHVEETAPRPRGKRARVHIAGEGNRPMDEALDREDGLVYVL